jgi:hypothetical protein
MAKVAGSFHFWKRDKVPPPQFDLKVTSLAESVHHMIEHTFISTSRVAKPGPPWMVDGVMMLSILKDRLDTMSDKGIYHTSRLVIKLVKTWRERHEPAGWGNILDKYGYPVSLVGDVEHRKQRFEHYLDIGDEILHGYGWTKVQPNPKAFKRPKKRVALKRALRVKIPSITVTGPNPFKELEELPPIPLDSDSGFETEGKPESAPKRGESYSAWFKKTRFGSKLVSYCRSIGFRSREAWAAMKRYFSGKRLSGDKPIYVRVPAFALTTVISGVAGAALGVLGGVLYSAPKTLAEGFREGTISGVASAIAIVPLDICGKVATGVIYHAGRAGQKLLARNI